MEQDIHIPEARIELRKPQRAASFDGFRQTPEIAVALLTGGRDKPYAFGMATELIVKGRGTGRDWWRRIGLPGISRQARSALS